MYFSADASKRNIGGTTQVATYTYKSGDYFPIGALQTPPTLATAGEIIKGDMWRFTYDYDMYKEIGIDVTQRAYEMLFKGTTSEENYAKSFWLASSGAQAYTDRNYWGVGMVRNGNATSGSNALFYIDGYWRASGLAVRPVVVLKSAITVDQIRVIEDKEEEAWSTSGGNE